MGEAKRRGTFEQRMAEGREKRERLERERLEMERRRLDAMTQGERAALRKAQMTLAMMLGMTAGVGYWPEKKWRDA